MSFIKNIFGNSKSNSVKFPNPADIEWVKVPAGEFLFGESNETRTVSQDFLIGIYPVTNAQYKIFIVTNQDYPVPADWDKNTRGYPEGKGYYPVILGLHL